jgi:hypothetical protein
MHGLGKWKQTNARNHEEKKKKKKKKNPVAMGLRFPDGAVAALAFNFVMGVSAILSTKALLGPFPYPTTLTLFHFLVSWAALSHARARGVLRVRPAAAARLDPWRDRLALGVLSAISPVLSNVSLKAVRGRVVVDFSWGVVCLFSTVHWV